MDPKAIERALRVGIASILAGSLPCVLACSPQCIGCGPCADAGSQYSVTYSLCDPDAGQAADVQVVDGGLSLPDAGSCFTSCLEACQANQSGGTCVSETDAGSGQRAAECFMRYSCIGGRRPDGLVDRTFRTDLGEALARTAWLEAASVFAFRRLARELAAHDAPDELVRRARASAHDEVRHARAMRALADAQGARVPAVKVDAVSVRDLEAIARENAVEACVSETLGAVLAVWQGERATDPAIRTAMRAIAPDELRHAALGWAIAAWVEPRLPPAARERVENARADAIATMMQNASIAPPKDVADAMGLPSSNDARAIMQRMLASGMWRRTLNAQVS